MPRNFLSKQEMKIRVLKLKNSLYEERRPEHDKELAHKYLNQILDILEEYRE